MSGTPELPVLRVKIGVGFERVQEYCFGHGTVRSGYHPVTYPLVCLTCGYQWRECSRNGHKEWVAKGQNCRCWADRDWDTIPEACACGHAHPFDPATVDAAFLERVVGIVPVVVVPVP